MSARPRPSVTAFTTSGILRRMVDVTQVDGLFGELLAASTPYLNDDEDEDTFLPSVPWCTLPPKTVLLFSSRQQEQEVMLAICH